MQVYIIVLNQNQIDSKLSKVNKGLWKDLFERFGKLLWSWQQVSIYYTLKQDCIYDYTELYDQESLVWIEAIQITKIWNKNLEENRRIELFWIVLTHFFIVYFQIIDYDIN